jgi:hypothetical protein
MNIGVRRQMKRSVLVVLSILVVSMLALPTVMVSATRAGTDIQNYLGAADATVDGKWTTATEWTDAATATPIPASFVWREKWSMPAGDIIEWTLVEFNTDNTNDAGDYFQLCFDPANNGGAAPQTDDIRIDYIGHAGQAGVTLYKGTGTGWAVYTTWTWGTTLTISEQRTSSQLNPAQHWILEMMSTRAGIFDTSGGGYTPGIRIAVYDASNAAAGVQAWPSASSRDNPADWGLETGVYGAIPESITLVPLFAIGAVAVAAAVIVVKKPKLR